MTPVPDLEELRRLRTEMQERGYAFTPFAKAAFNALPFLLSEHDRASTLALEKSALEEALAGLVGWQDHMSPAKGTTAEQMHRIALSFDAARALTEAKGGNHDADAG